VSLFVKVTRPPTGISTCWGLTPAEVIVTVAALGEAGCVVDGGEPGLLGLEAPPPPQAGARSASTERPTIAERDDPERRLDTEPPPITFPTTRGVISAGEEASGVPKGSPA
jgi:hypothetical protein